MCSFLLYYLFSSYGTSAAAVAAGSGVSVFYFLLSFSFPFVLFCPSSQNQDRKETDHTQNTHTPTEKRQHVSKNPKPFLFNVSFPFVLFWKTHELQKEISLRLLNCFTAKKRECPPWGSTKWLRKWHVRNDCFYF